MTRQTFTEALAERVLLLDGGFGTMLQTYDLGDCITKSPDDRRGCNDLLSVTRPDVVGDIHRRYLEAGADVIETNSFNANAISLSDYGLQDRAYEIARAAAMVAREAADGYSTEGWPRYVAGSMGPTNKTLSMSADVTSPASREVTFAEMYRAYHDQARGLIDGGVDVLLVETVFDTLNAKAALSAIRDIAPDIPVMVSVTISDASGRTLTGQTIEAVCASVMHARPVTVGLNCGFGAAHLLPHLRRLAAVCPVRVSVHPNAGLPNVLGGYDETPEMFVADIQSYLREGLVNIVGGCCGTTPDHIRLLRELLKTSGGIAQGATDGTNHFVAPRPLPEATHRCVLSGLEPLTVSRESNFINVGERTNVAGSAKFARLIREGNYDEALSIARAQVLAGAQIVDVCMDAPLIDGVEAMTRFLNLMASEPEVARVPVMIDSSNWPVIEAGLQCVQGKGIVNSISLKEGEEVFLEHARKIMNYGAAAVVMLFDERGQADTYERKIEVARRAYDLLCGIGFNPEDIIFDPNILAVATGMPEHDRYARDFIEATRWIKANLPYAKVSGGVSNLSFAFRGNNAVRRAMHAVFLYHAIAAGMDMAIVNPQMVQLYDDIEPELLGRVEDMILYRREDAAERLIEYAGTLVAESGAPAPVDEGAQWRSQPVEGRIARAMLTGDTQYIEADTLEAYRASGRAVDVIESMLMPAMARVGELFGEGKMFLPQVVKSARVMKQAVAVLEPYMRSGSLGADAPSTVAPSGEEGSLREPRTIDKVDGDGDALREGRPDGQERTIDKVDGDGDALREGRRPVIVMATVKGDVHDIGKNIVAVVLQCNGYDVHDLGVMVPAETIVEEARRTGAAVICLSGLITPSLDEMINVAREAERQGLTIPILVGGATTSALHTALKIAPVTKAPVIHSTDAADNANVVAALLGRDSAAFLQAVKHKQQELREGYRARKSPGGCPCCGGTKAAGRGEDKPTAETSRTLESSREVSRSFENSAVESCVTEMHPRISEVEDRINWSAFFAAWGIPGRYPEIFKHPVRGEEARKLYDDAQVMLRRMEDEGLVRLAGFIQTLPARAEGDDIVLLTANGEYTLPMIRSTKKLPTAAGGGVAAPSPSPLGECVADFVAESQGRVTLFAMTAGIGCAELCDRLRKDGDDYGAIMAKLLCDRLVEAFADTVLSGGCRIAIGYPSVPDHTLKRDVFDLLGVESRSPMRLTETYMIMPGESICGLYFDKGHFFEMGDIPAAEIERYARRRNLPLSLISKNFR